MAPPSLPEEERRNHQRRTAAGLAAIRVLGEGRTQTGRVIDLSRGGVLLDTSPLEIGTRVQTEFLGLKASGTVLRNDVGVGVTGSTGIAIRFDEVQDSIESVIAVSVSKLTAPPGLAEPPKGRV